MDTEKVRTSTAVADQCPTAKKSKKKSEGEEGDDGPLTDAELKFFKPEPKRYYEGDGQGLYIEVFPTGGKAWRYRYRLNGKTEKVVLGKYPSVSLKAARESVMNLATMVSKVSHPRGTRAKRRLWTPQDHIAAVWRALLHRTDKAKLEGSPK